ncbi:type II secretion system F family protein [Nocardioides panacis]|uniref:Type II secretion system F family protein n=1 Tax=Nocardioides panacis TaxID=2849501 RepID=A0A975SWX8_9ACTN|nr:type II secretion system F family protein [Nocardioides panacis]QWZ07439.1 type II secretion system F family protein [Nocardioides panacis]
MSAGSHAALTLVAAVGAAVAVAAALPSRRPAPGTLTAPATPGRGPRERPPPLRTLATAAVALGAGVLVGGPLAAVVGLAAGAVCWRVVGRLEAPAARRHRLALAAAVPHVVDLMAACLAAGLSPAAALEEIRAAVGPPVREELAAVSHRLQLGVDPVTVWSDLARHPQLGGLGRALARAARSGASVADAMQRLADDLRRAARADVESRARAVGVQAAIPLGLCLLPAFVLVGVAPLVAGSLGVLAGR